MINKYYDHKLLKTKLSRTPKSKNQNNPEAERGAAMIVALIVIVAFIVIASASIQTVTAISREGERDKQKRIETARAEYYISMAEATLKHDIRNKYNDYQLTGKQMELKLKGTGKLPMFDPLIQTESRPLLDLDGNHTGIPPDTATSLYGSSNRWASLAVNVSNRYIATKSAEKNITAPDGVQILFFSEAFRRQITGIDEPIYAFKYIVEATAGVNTQIKKEDTILLGPVRPELIDQLAINQNCSDLELTGIANPANVSWGNSTNLEVTYKKAERVIIYEDTGGIIFDRVVTSEDTPRTVSQTTNPISSPKNFIAEAVRGTCQIQVPISVGVQFNQNISYTVNGVQTVNIIEGENVQYIWQTSNAQNGYTTSWITYSNQAGNFYDNIYSNSINAKGPVQSISSVLHVRDTRYNGGTEQTAAININVCRLPRLTSFTATPDTVNAGGGTVRLAWTTQFASGVRIPGVGTFGPNGFVDIPAPAATRDYDIEAISDCGAPSAKGQTRVNVASCQIPVINNFSVNPDTVRKGENRNIVFNWNVSGNITSQSIDQGVGAVSGSSHTIVQPQNTTWYNYTVTGCGQTQTVRVKVNVNSSSNSIDCATKNRADFAPLGGNSFITFKGTTYELFLDDVVDGIPVSLRILVTQCYNNYAQNPVLYETTLSYQGTINSTSNSLLIDYVELVSLHPSLIQSEQQLGLGARITSPALNKFFVYPDLVGDGFDNGEETNLSIVIKYRLGTQTYLKPYHVKTGILSRNLFSPPYRTKTGYSFGIIGFQPIRFGLTEDWTNY